MTCPAYALMRPSHASGTFDRDYVRVLDGVLTNELQYCVSYTLALVRLERRPHQTPLTDDTPLIGRSPFDLHEVDPGTPLKTV